ncbi:MAG: metal-dependent hydrolase [Anaerolineaceae bacterium]
MELLRGKMTILFTFYGHAAIGIETSGFHILVDPFLSGNPKASISAEKVPADFILVTHGHGDHLGDSLSIAKRTGATLISNAEICNWASGKGIQVHGQHIGGGFHYPFGYLKLTNALHGSNLPDGSNGGNPVGFLLTTLDNKKIYLAGDTGLFGDMSLIGDEGIDLAALPIGDNYTMGPADALRAVQLLRPRTVIPIHYNTFPLLQQDPVAWAKQVEEKTSAQVKILQPSETFTF